MRTALFAAGMAMILSATGLAAFTTTLARAPDAPRFAHTPVRAHVALGPVRALARPDREAGDPDLDEAAQARYGRVDALANVRTEPLPWSGAALVTATAIRWD